MVSVFLEYEVSAHHLLRVVFAYWVARVGISVSMVEDSLHSQLRLSDLYILIFSDFHLYHTIPAIHFVCVALFVGIICGVYRPYRPYQCVSSNGLRSAVVG